MLRCALFFVLCLSVFSVAGLSSARAERDYGSVICQQNTECPVYNSNPAHLVAQAASCATRYFGFRREVFDETNSVDMNGCVSVKSGQTFGSSSVPMVPTCCYEPLPTEGRCQLRCEVHAVR